MCFVDKEPLDINDYIILTLATILALPAMIIVAVITIFGAWRERLH